MAVDFVILSRTAEAIKVLHVVHGHRFTFRVSDRRRQSRVLRRDYSAGRASHRADRDALRDAAFAFAEREARAAGLID